MIERVAGSRKTILAIREAEKIAGRYMAQAPEPAWRGVAAGWGRRLGRGLLAAGFLTLCSLPALTVLALVTLAIFLAR